jgi:hypothetical protein
MAVESSGYYGALAQSIPLIPLYLSFFITICRYVIVGISGADDDMARTMSVLPEDR